MATCSRRSNASAPALRSTRRSPPGWRDNEAANVAVPTVLLFSYWTVSVMHVFILLFGVAFSLRAFLCITGQLSRLEMDTKLRFFVTPNRELHEIDVAFVLDTNSTHSTNNVVPRGAVASPSEIVLSVEEAGATVLFFNSQKQTENPTVSQIYLKQLNKRKFLPEQRLERAQNHYRQYEASSRCRIPHLSHIYDMYIRLRDDTMFTTQFILSPLPEGIHVPRCNSWGGINDRGAIVVGLHNAVIYFSIIDRFMTFDRTFKPERRRAIFNPETFFAESMADANVTVHIDCAMRLPFLSSHLDIFGRCVTEIDRGLSQWSKPSPLDTCPSVRIGIGVRCSMTDEWIRKCAR